MRIASKIPLSLKIIFTAFLALLIITYWIYYGPQNLLWFCDITLILAYIATIFEKRLIASMATVGGFVYTTLWSLDFFWVLGNRLLGSSQTGFAAAYMFDSHFPLWLRFISCFHIVLPFFLIYLVYRLGYDKRAWLAQFLLLSGLIIVAWLVTKPAENIDFVFSYLLLMKAAMDSQLYLGLEIIFTFIIIIITDVIFMKIDKAFHD